jgi:hypothetical protein
MNGGSQATFPADQLIPIAYTTHKNRLQLLMLADTGCQTCDLFLVEFATRLERIIVDFIDAQFQGRAANSRKAIEGHRSSY